MSHKRSANVVDWCARSIQVQSFGVGEGRFQEKGLSRKAGRGNGNLGAQAAGLQGAEYAGQWPALPKISFLQSAGITLEISKLAQKRKVEK
ncbi:MAG TPA: hypothetical protein VKC60_01405, partial [Opitutaceae bacterium]|nr:hypothetical protein [Opitutaceae bacterium]